MNEERGDRGKKGRGDMELFFFYKSLQWMDDIY